MTPPDRQDGAIHPAHPGETGLFQRLALILLGTAPALFALVTWQEHYSSTSLRYFSVPIVVAEIGLIACIVLSGTRITAALSHISRMSRIGGIGLIAVAAASTYLIAPLQDMARPHFVISMIHLVLALMLVAALRTSWHGLRRPMLIALAIGAALQAVVSWGLALSVRSMPDFDWLHFGAGVTHVRQLGFCGLSLSGLAAGLYATATDRKARFAYFVLLVLGFAWTDLSGGRASIGAALVGAAAVVLLSPRAQWARLALAFLAAMLIAAPLSLLAMAATPYILKERWGLYTAWVKLIGEAGTDDFSSRRTELWVQTIAAIRQSPLFGHGEGQFRSLVPATLGRLNHPHNSILQFLYQWGIVGSAFLAMMVVPTLLSGWRAARADGGVVLPAAGAIVGLGAMSMLDGPLNYPFPVMVVIIGLTMIASVRPASD